MSASSTTDPNELKRLATRAVALKAIVDDATFKKKALRDALLRLQEALERRRAEEERLRLQAEEEERRAAAAEAARLRAEEAARLAAVAHRQQLAFAAGGLVLGVATAMFVRSARHHPVLDAVLDAARRPLQHLWAAAARSRVGRAALVAARRGLDGVTHGAAALGRGLGGVLLQAQSVGALDSDVRPTSTRLLQEASRRAAPCESSILDGLTLVVGGAAAVGGLSYFLAKPKAIESQESKDEPEEARAPEPEEEEDDDVHMPNPTLRGVVSPPMAPFMASAAARPLPPAPRRRATPFATPVTPALPPPPPPVAVVTPESEEPSPPLVYTSSRVLARPRRAEPPKLHAFLEEYSHETTGLCGPWRRLLACIRRDGGFMRDQAAQETGPAP